MVAESACIPVPSELIMTFGGALAAGAIPGTHLNLVAVIIAGVAGTVAGSYTPIGCIPWTAALAYAGYAVGANWQSIVNGFHTPTYIIAAFVVIALAIAIWRYARHHQTAGNTPPDDQQPDPAGRPPRASSPR